MKKWVVGNSFLLSVLLLAVVLGTGWSCSKDGTFFDANPAAPFSAKTVASYNPFAGLDEDGYVEGVGAPKNYHAFLQMYAQRLAVALNDPAVRQIFLQAIDSAHQKEATLTKVLSGRPELLKTLADGFLRDVDNASLSDSRLTDIIADYDDRKAFLSVSEALFGLEITLVDRAGTYQGQTPIDVFHNPITDEKDIEIYKHAGINCEYEVFLPETVFRYGREDELNVKVWEDDIFPNPDDNVGEWRYVRMSPTGNKALTPESSTKHGKPQHAQVNLHTNRPGKSLP